MKSIQLKIDEIVANDPSLPKTKGFSNNIVRELRKTLNCDFTVYKEMIAEYLATKFAISSTDAFDAATTITATSTSCTTTIPSVTDTATSSDVSYATITAIVSTTIGNDSAATLPDTGTPNTDISATIFPISSTDAFDACTTVSNIKNDTATITAIDSTTIATDSEATLHDTIIGTPLTSATNGTVTDFAANIIPTITNAIVNPNNVTIDPSTTIDAMDYDDSATV